MNRIYVPMTELDDWKNLLAQPDKHWKAGFSAMSMAQSWHNSNGFPPSIVSVFAASEESFRSLTPLIILPEHQVPLDNGSAPSQSDVWVLASHTKGLASISVEGKVSEPFGDPLAKWLSNASTGKQQRLDFLQEILGLDHIPDTIRYQLLHRAASAIIEAKRFHANIALFIVQSFSDTDEGYSDFKGFCDLFNTNKQIEPNKIVQLGQHDNIPFYAVWIQDQMLADAI